MDNPEHVLNARLEAAHAILYGIAEAVLGESQKAVLDVALRRIASNALHRVVNDDLSEFETSLLTHAAVEYAFIRDMLAVATDTSGM